MHWTRGICVIAIVLIGSAHAQAPATAGKVLILRQSVSGPGAGVTSTSLGRAASALPTPRSVTLDLDGRPIAAPEVAGTLPVRDFGVGLSLTQIKAQSNATIRAAVPGLVTALQNHMRTNGYAVAFYDFVQTVRVVGVAEPRYLTWSMVVYPGQRPVYREPVIIDGQQRTLHIVYTPRAVASGLPSAWNYPNAGMLHYRVVDRAGATVVNWTDVDVGGAYDAPPIVNGLLQNPDAGVECLLRRAVGCPTGVLNAQDVMDRVGLSSAVVDYRRAIAPVYDQVAVTNADGSRGVEQRARSAVSVTLRTFSANGCRGTYRNAGTFGYLLEERTDRYTATLDGTYALVQQLAASNLSPTADYDLSKELSTGSSVATLTDKIIDFSNAANPLLSVSRVPGLLSVAPITVSANSFGDTRVIADYHYGSCGRAIVLRASCNASGDIRLQIGVTGDVPNCARGEGVGRYLVDTTLRNGVPVPLTYQADTDREFPVGISWEYDGSRIIFDNQPTYPFSFRRSEPGTNPFASLLFAPTEGYFEKENFPNGGPASFFRRTGYQCPAGLVAGPTGTPPRCYQPWIDDTFHNGNTVHLCFPDPTPGNTQDGGQICGFYRPTNTFAVQLLLQN